MISDISYLGMLGNIDPLYLIIMGGTMLLSFLVSNTLKRRFAEYSHQPLPISGREVAERMLRDYGINDVQVMSVPGQLTDHYNPANKTVNLSEGVYNQRSVAAAAVAAHECGHAVQHQQAYQWLTLRSKMVPAVSIANNMLNVLMMLFVFGFFITQSPLLIWAMVICLAVVAGFSIVTLPVEFDASKRALAWIGNNGLGGSMEQEKAKNALFWAAMTYVVGALSSVAMLVYWLMILLGRRD
ncbi:MAG: zinc metallopeptidase [Verrucomicrobiales bacterium]|nr:zinc metallopeptidase [Verrucomicrobiales bacterium]